MKGGLVSLIFFCLALAWPGNAFCDPIDDLLGEFVREYEALKPPVPGASTESDYKIGQAALGTLYTTKTLKLLYRQNQEILARHDEMLRRYDEIIRQNQEIIRILSTLAKKRAGIDVAE